MDSNGELLLCMDHLDDRTLLNRDHPCKKEKSL